MRSEEYCTIVKEHEINMKGRVESKKMLNRKLNKKYKTKLL